MSHHCIYPRCPESCCQCNYAVALITADEVAERLDAAADLLGPEGWERFRRTAHGRALVDLIHDCSVFVEHYEDAARKRAKHQQAVADFAASVMCPAALRSKGAL